MLYLARLELAFRVEVVKNYFTFYKLSRPLSLAHVGRGTFNYKLLLMGRKKPSQVSKYLQSLKYFGIY